MTEAGNLFFGVLVGGMVLVIFFLVLPILKEVIAGSGIVGVEGFFVYLIPFFMFVTIVLSILYAVRGG